MGRGRRVDLHSAFLFLSLFGSDTLSLWPPFPYPWVLESRLNVLRLHRKKDHHRPEDLRLFLFENPYYYSFLGSTEELNDEDFVHYLRFLAMHLTEYHLFPAPHPCPYPSLTASFLSHRHPHEIMF